LKKIKNKPIIFFYLIIILYYVFCWYNYRILENGKENNYLLNMQYNECEKYIKADSETQKEIYEKYKDKFIVDENCKDLVIEGEKPNSVYSIYQGFLSSEKFIIPFFMPLLVLIPFMYILSKEYNGKMYIQVADTLKGIDSSDNRILDRELRSLKKINDNYQKIVLTSDKISLANEEGIIIRNVLDWLLDK
jgi:hypothetical protein